MFFCRPWLHFEVLRLSNIWRAARVLQFKFNGPLDEDDGIVRGKASCLSTVGIGQATSRALCSKTC